jgi:penicillin-binding protein 2
VAWFAGFAPADNPKYAFSAVYESDVANSDDVHGGSHAAPLIGKVLREVFKEEAAEKKKEKKKAGDKKGEEEIEVRRAEPVEPKQEPARD